MEWISRISKLNYRLLCRRLPRRVVAGHVRIGASRPESVMPASSPPDHEYVFRLPRSALRIAGYAFGVGLLLFVIVWWVGRDQSFYKVAPTAPGKPLSELDALPEPLAGGDSASDMPSAGADTDTSERPQLVETPPPPALPTPIDEADPLVDGDATLPIPPAAVAMAPGEQPVPLSGQSPPPRYPTEALRRGESGTVLVRVEVDANGMPGGVALVQRSGSRDLDRAAMEAVRKWRFMPAQRDGQAIAASLVIPIDFKAEQ